MTDKQLRSLEYMTRVWFIAAGLAVLSVSFFVGCAAASQDEFPLLLPGSLIALELTCFTTIIGSMLFLRDLHKARQDVARQRVRSGGTMETPDEVGAQQG